MITSRTPSGTAIPNNDRVNGCSSTWGCHNLRRPNTARSKIQRNIDTDVSFDFEGASVWYFCRRDKNLFIVRHIMAQIAKGRLVGGQVATFEGC